MYMQSHLSYHQQPAHQSASESTSATGDEGKSEVARLLRQIDLEYAAALQGLTGLSFGTARHDFINARMEQVAVYHEHLATQVGEAEATRLIYDHYVNSIG
jgi:hypothetical protein